MAKLGIKETKELLKFGFAVPKAIKKAQEDGKVDLFDAGLLIPVLSVAPEAFEGIQLVIAELADLDEAEWAELKEIAKAEVGELGDEKLVAIVVQALTAAQQVYALVKLF